MPVLQNYAKRRGNQQEGFYNLGRAAHQVGLLHLAAPWYQRCLAAQPARPSSSGPSIQVTLQLQPYACEIVKTLIVTCWAVVRPAKSRALSGCEGSECDQYVCQRATDCCEWSIIIKELHVR